MLTAKEIRQSFLDFFASKGHLVVPSAPMVIKNDPTLMFTNAGMNQFKDIILGNAEAKSKRCCDSQKCLRVSGKHNDLEEVGHDTYHHTMFEMLGNWSFGDYFKKEAIDWAWEYLTGVLKLDPKYLYATVFEGSAEEGLDRDNEAAGYWEQYLPKDHIINGNKHDNFWEMGDTGPCGPCSEIHIDLRDESEKAKVPGRELVNHDNPLVIEIWNLVFMQYNRKADGSLEGLPAKVIDTGMGFERLCMAIQGKKSNYDTDVFTPLIAEIGKITDNQYGKSKEVDVAMRVIADHIRTLVFSIADGQLPSNAKAGYVIRRILRRAVRYGYTFLHQQEAFMYKLVPAVIESMGVAYPEIVAQKELETKVIKEEEEAFLRTLANGIGLLDKVMSDTKKAGKTEISGKEAFTLYDTFGFPLDLTELILRENGMTVNEAEFTEEMNKQKERARNAASVETGDWMELKEGNPTFVGYDQLEVETSILRYRKIKQKKEELFQIVLEKTPFYGEMGGQIGDCGYIEVDGEKINIIDTKKENDLTVHLAKKMPANANGKVKAVVSAERRQAIANNHTATHLLDYALRQVLGSHVEQKGSLVTADSLRFDFSHFQKVTDEELRKAEQIANKMVRDSIALEEAREMPIEEAKKMGAIALFGEKYGDKVRVVKFGPSVEFCGGTHVCNTGSIGMIKIVSESSVAAGVRRIEAVTAEKAEELFNEQQDTLRTIKEIFNNVPNLVQAIQKSMDENAELKKEIEKYVMEKIRQQKEELIGKAEQKGDVKVIVLPTGTEMAPEMAKSIGFQIKNDLASEKMIYIAGTKKEGKPTLTLVMTDALVATGLNASQLIREAAKEIQGGGGGQPFFAQAGGKNVDGLQKAVEILKSKV
ncbi:MAG: alanine--tRNA ligase [Paludibacteraceae bacterium]|nr:alanine--tRNA ligase [Candidatus Physcocola equi]MCQ2234333.1 alanine--tRNA ligase [Paludibacteraceae bacterium]